SFLDADDYYAPDKIAQNVQFLEDYPQYGVVHSDVLQIGADSTPIQAPRLAPEECPTGWVFPDLVLRCWITNSAVCCHTDLIRRHVNFEKYAARGYVMQDYPMWLDLALQSQFGYINQPLVHYRRLQESVSHSADPARSYRFWVSSCRVRLDYCREQQ